MSLAYRLAYYALIIFAVPLMWTGSLLAYWSEICLHKAQPASGRQDSRTEAIIREPAFDKGSRLP